MALTLAVLLTATAGQPPASVPWANKLFLPGVADDPGQAPPPVLVHSFGAVPRGTLCVRTVKLTNIYAYPLQVAGTSRESAGLEPYPPQRVLNPFESADFTFTLDTRNLPAGKSVHSLTATVVAGGVGVEHHSPAFFRFEVAVRPDVALTPGELALGSVPFGQTRAATTVIEHAGKPGWRITGATADGPVAVRVDEAGRNKYKLTAELKATAPPGRVSATVSLATTDPTLPTVTVPVTGTVLAPVSATPDVVRFGAVKVGEKDEYSVMVRGVSNRGFMVRPVADPGDGVSVEAFGFPVPTQVVKVRFQPTKPGAVRKDIRLETDLPGSPAVVIRIEAVGE